MAERLRIARDGSRGHLIASPKSLLRGAVSRWLVRPRLTARE
jgi:hypothetical protein